MIEQFEKLPEIAERLHTVVYNENLNQYHAAMINSGLSVKYIQGAWYVYQEQHKSHQQETERLKTELLAAEVEIARLQSRVDGAMDFYNIAKSDANIGMMRIAQHLKGEVK